MIFYDFYWYYGFFFKNIAYLFLNHFFKLSNTLYKTIPYLLKKSLYDILSMVHNSNPQCNDCSSYIVFSKPNLCLDSNKTRFYLSKLMSAYMQNKERFKSLEKVGDPHPLVVNFVQNTAAKRYSLLLYRHDGQRPPSDFYLFDLVGLKDYGEGSYNLKSSKSKGAGFEMISHPIYISKDTNGLFSYAEVYGLVPKPVTELMCYAITAFDVLTDGKNISYFAAIPRVEQDCK